MDTMKGINSREKENYLSVTPSFFERSPQTWANNDVELNLS